MKKLLSALFTLLVLALIVFILLVKFKVIKSSNAINNVVAANGNETVDTIEVVEDTYVDDNPIVIGIYWLNSSIGKRVLQKEYKNTWAYHKDIVEFNIAYSNDETIDGTRTAVCYGKYMANYDSSITDKYKNGFHIYFETSDGIFDKTILRPSDTDDLYDYLEVYLYDGYHRAQGEWYSHTTEADFNEKTIFTTIKLTAGKNVDKITSDIELTAFTYDDDDFDESLNYKGKSKYTIPVKKLP